VKAPAAVATVADSLTRALTTVLAVSAASLASSWGLTLYSTGISNISHSKFPIILPTGVLPRDIPLDAQMHAAKRHFKSLKILKRSQAFRNYPKISCKVPITPGSFWSCLKFLKAVFGIFGLALPQTPCSMPPAPSP
jgi:hypothetical protein